MAEVTVQEFAEQVGIPVDRLLTQLSEAGLGDRNPDAAISDEDKATLLAHLRQSQRSKEPEDGAPAKITLTRKSHSQIKLPAASTSTRGPRQTRSEEHTSELQSRGHLVCRLLLEKKKKKTDKYENRINNETQ